MGIKNLSKIINEHSPPTKREISYFSNRKVAIDASMVLYQCLIAIRTTNMNLETSEFKNAHLMGLYYKLIKFMENRINIIFIFDGKPPEEKSSELFLRNEKREQAYEKQQIAEEIGDIDLFRKMEKRQVRIEERHVIESIELLKLMGIPFYIAPGEAEAFSVFLYKKGLVDFISSEDMDVITYGGRLVRNLNSSNDKKKPILEYDYNKILKNLNLTAEQFTDLCILLGCDYTGTLRNIGPAKSFSLIKEHDSIENILKNKKYEIISKNRHKERENTCLDNNSEDNEDLLEGSQNEHKIAIKTTGEDFNYEKARKIFKNEFSEETIKDVEKIEIKYKTPNFEGLIEYLCVERSFNEEKIKKGIERMKICKKNLCKKRITDFLIKK